MIRGVQQNATITTLVKVFGMYSVVIALICFIVAVVGTIMASEREQYIVHAGESLLALTGIAMMAGMMYGVWNKECTFILMLGATALGTTTGYLLIFPTLLLRFFFQ